MSSAYPPEQQDAVDATRERRRKATADAAKKRQARATSEQRETPQQRSEKSGTKSQENE